MRQFFGKRAYLVVLVIGDLTALLAAMKVAFTLKYGSSIPELEVGFLKHVLPTAAVMAIVCFWLLDLYSSSWKSIREILFGICIAGFFVGLATLGLASSLNVSGFPYTIVALFVGLSLVFVLFWRILIQAAENGNRPIRQAMLVGTPRAEKCVRELTLGSHGRVLVRQVVEDVESAEELLQAGGFDAVYITDSLNGQSKQRLLTLCIQKAIRVYLIPDSYDILVSRSEVENIGDLPLLRIDRLQISPVQAGAKRLLDLTLSIFALPAFLVLVPILLIANRLEGRGPLFYSQERVGILGRDFKVIKFRTMVPDAERHTGPTLACQWDERITRVGRVLRATRMDELPQILNVLFGQMSIVGPRPERRFFVTDYARQIPHYMQRLQVKPGLTGLAQVKGRYDTDVVDKLKYDLLYIRNYSLVLDLKIILQTVGVILNPEQAQGTSQADKVTYPEAVVSSAQGR